MVISSISHGKLETLRGATLGNNIVWLQSFGCEVEGYDGLIHVQHPHLREYSAWLITARPKKAARHLKRILHDSKEPQTSPDIYLDEASVEPGIESLLSESKYEHSFLSITIANSFSSGYEPGTLMLEPAEHQFEQWLSLYSEGFSRSGRFVEIDRARWLYTLEHNDYVRHWFFVKDNRKIGICQTCTAKGVVGVYSFSITPESRHLSNLRAALRALEGWIADEGERYMYFERLLPANSRRIWRPSHHSKRIVIVRKMLGYRRSMDGV